MKEYQHLGSTAIQVTPLDLGAGRFGQRMVGVPATLRTIATQLDATPARVALRWLLDRDRVTCVPVGGGRTVEQVEETLATVSLTLTETQRERITAVRPGDADAGGDQ